MKKILLFAAMAVLTMTSFGQTVWDFTTLYPLESGASTTISQGVSNNMGYFVDPNGTTPKTTFTVDYSKKTFASGGTFAGGDLYSRFKLGGKGSDTSSSTPYMPTQNFIYFNVTGACTITVFTRCSTSSPTDGRVLYVTDGTNLLASYAATDDSPYILTANYTGGEGVIYIYGYINAYNFYRIEASANVGTTVEIAATSGVNTVNVNKTVKNIKYFDAMGKQIPENSKGLVIKKVTYTDGTSDAIKTFVKEK